jgi:4-aminobutyrate aminotransferase-like enzyme
MLPCLLVRPPRQCHADDDPTAAAAGVMVLTCGTYGNVIRLLPPLVIPDHLLAEGLDVLEAAISDAAAG